MLFAPETSSGSEEGEGEEGVSRLEEREEEEEGVPITLVPWNEVEGGPFADKIAEGGGSTSSSNSSMAACIDQTLEVEDAPPVQAALVVSSKITIQHIFKS